MPLLGRTEPRSRVTCVVFVGSGVSGLGRGGWRQQYDPLAGEGWMASVGWLLAVLAGICGRGVCRLDRREDR